MEIKEFELKLAGVLKEMGILVDKVQIVGESTLNSQKILNKIYIEGILR